MTGNSRTGGYNRIRHTGSATGPPWVLASTYSLVRGKHRTENSRIHLMCSSSFINPCCKIPAAPNARTWTPRRASELSERDMIIKVGSNRRKSLALLIAIATAVVGFFLSTEWTEGPAFAQSTVQVPDVPIVPKMIAGKPYSVTPGGSP